jgi:inner membrane protein
MITLYAKQLFGNWKPALTAGSILTLQYGFIFVLIRLEDTALLVGSIGLFIVLGLVMYASRKIDWYGKSAQ